MSSGSRILVIDDEPQIHRFLRPALEAAGFAVIAAETAAEGLRLIAGQAPDLVLLDLGLPDLDGQEVLRRLRGFSDVPVIVLSAREREAEKIAALDNGADDYVEKPFALGELLARTRAALRRVTHLVETTEIIRAGAIEIDLARHEVRRDGAAIALTPREFAVLALLARHHGRVLTHRQILTTLWGPAHAEDIAYLRVSVWQLRRKLGDGAERLLVNEPGIGYRLRDDEA
ncbi:MAG: response regulator transcription factor [Acidibrevibacterium sp.]|jgi:two-component system KDP operon response regulator KdpE|uniref:response regulator n=1 Tax=Acidibrevibacterium fodinaquatile TaxID=1969806 RepID=UPI0023A890CE|nr:response regulator transcription factor [Acidibrevibacterium fodinaquatile]MCA7119690.1 response regulator transcription factor [Acidibrevibacterium fodinaquatile]